MTDQPRPVVTVSYRITAPQLSAPEDADPEQVQLLAAELSRRIEASLLAQIRALRSAPPRRRVGSITLDFSA